MEGVDDEKIRLEKKEKGEREIKKRWLAMLRCPLFRNERAWLERCVDVVK